MKYTNCHAHTPQLERGVSEVVGGLTASTWPSSNKQDVTLSFAQTSPHITSHAGLRVTTVFMSIWLSLTCSEMCCILNTWQILIVAVSVMFFVFLKYIQSVFY